MPARGVILVRTRNRTARMTLQRKLRATDNRTGTPNSKRSSRFWPRMTKAKPGWAPFETHNWRATRAQDEDEGAYL